MTERLTPKLQKVCLLYLEGMSMRAALLKAGYSDSYAIHNASKFLHNRAAQKFIRERQKQVAEASLADAVFVERKLVELIDDKSISPKDRIEAMKSLDKHHQWMKELNARYDELKVAQTAAPTAPITININELKSNDKNII